MVTKAVFFDKDGVLSPMVNGHGAWNMREVFFTEHSKETVLDIQDLGFMTFMITNQPDPECDEDFIEDMMKLFMHYYGFDDAMYARIRGSNYYKPNTGMVDVLIKLHNIDVSKSYFVGDRWRDVVCGHNAGMKTIWLKPNMFNNYEDETPEEYKHIKPTFDCYNISQVYDIIAGDIK